MNQQSLCIDMHWSSNYCRYSVGNHNPFEIVIKAFELQTITRSLNETN